MLTHPCLMTDDHRESWDASLSSATGKTAGRGRSDALHPVCLMRAMIEKHVHSL